MEADPRASVTFRGRVVEVAARPDNERERVAVMADADGVDGGYLTHQARITGRTVLVLVLEPAG